MADKATAIASKGVQDPEAVIAIDLGSAINCAVIAWPEGDRIRAHTIGKFTDAKLDLNDMAQTSFCILPDDDCKEERKENLIKFMPYALLGTTEVLKKQHPVLSRMWEKRYEPGFNDALFKDRTEKAFKQILHTILIAVKKSVNVGKSDDLNMQIKKIALTVPSCWCPTFENLYGRLVKGVFQDVFADVAPVVARNIDVVFPTEASSLAQYILYIFHQCSIEKEVALREGMPNIDELTNKPNAQCWIQCGEQNTITEQYLVKYPDLCEMTLPLKQVFKQDIKKKTVRLFKESSLFLTELHPRTGGIVSLVITKAMDKEAFQTAFEHVKIMIREQLERLASIKQGWRSKDHEVTIVLSGESSLHPEFVKWIQALCAELRLPEAVFAHHIEIFYGHARIAKGSAYSALTQESVASFAEECAFGLCKLKVTRRGPSDEYPVWRQSADTIWYQERGAIHVTFDAEGDGTEFRIVCQPFWRSLATDLQTDECMDEGTSYEFLRLDFGHLPSNLKARVEFDFDVQKEQISLCFVLIPDSGESVKRAAATKDPRITVGPFDVGTQSGTSCLTIQQSTDEINEIVKKARRAIVSALGSSGAGGSAAASRKRPAPCDADTTHLAKRTRADNGLFSSALAYRPRPDASEARVRRTTGRDWLTNVPFRGPRPTSIAAPRTPRIETTASTNISAGTAIAETLLAGTRSLPLRPLPVRTRLPAGSLRPAKTLSGDRSANRDPLKSD
ncbi:hypothetical protein Daus18300_009691 [Diaporthe australafricana]|uniref:Uncharacterized protein n=1 Tax=Diaporthe australafricana TaxID=127596 RepID=A0ABR3WD77_9PEZI